MNVHTIRPNHVWVGVSETKSMHHVESLTRALCDKQRPETRDQRESDNKADQVVWIGEQACSPAPSF